MSAFLLISESFTLSVCLSFRLLNFLPIFLRQLLTDRKEFQTFNGFYREVREISFFSVGCWCQIKNLFANILITKFTEELGKFSLFFCWLLMSDQKPFYKYTNNEIYRRVREIFTLFLLAADVRSRNFLHMYFQLFDLFPTYKFSIWRFINIKTKEKTDFPKMFQSRLSADKPKA